MERPLATPALGLTGATTSEVPSTAIQSGAPARLARVALLASSDLAALSVAGVLAYLSWALPVHEQPPQLYTRLLPLLPLFTLGYAQAGLYPGLGIGPVERLRRFTLSTFFVFLVLGSFAFALKLPHVYSRVTYGIALLSSLALVPLFRSAALFVVAGWRRFREPVLLVGSAVAAGQLASTLTKGGPPVWQAVARVGPPPSPGAAEHLRWLGDVEPESLRAAPSCRVAIVCADHELHPGALDTLQQELRHVVVARAGERLPVEGLQVRQLGEAIGIEYTNNLLARRNRLVKRGVDMVLGSLALLLSLPVIVASMTLVRLTSRGSALFHHRREGLAGREFAMPKIRTMYIDADRRLAAHLASSPDLGQEWQERLKLRDDPRLVGRLGRLLRRLSIDELPQLWSVLRGDMSLVGPRPFPDYHVARFSPAFRHLRQRVRPGITGLWQVVVRSDGSIEDQERLDTYYIHNWSLWLDLYLLARTAGAVLAGRGAY